MCSSGSKSRRRPCLHPSGSASSASSSCRSLFVEPATAACHLSTSPHRHVSFSEPGTFPEEDSGISYLRGVSIPVFLHTRSLCDCAPPVNAAFPHRIWFFFSTPRLMLCCTHVQQQSLNPPSGGAGCQSRRLTGYERS